MTKKRLDVLLVERGLCPTRSQARARVMAGDVVVGDHRVEKPGAQVHDDVDIRLKGGIEKWVSRGAKKLLGALDAFDVSVSGRICMDVGASTGGFSDVLLHKDARHVFAIDVGHGQIAWRIREHERVTNMERTHIGRMEAGILDPVPDLAVVDVSFISLVRVLPAMAAQLAPSCDIVALIKPQFEVGRARLGKGGIVRDEGARQDAISAVTRAAEELSMTRLGLIESPITGADGNVEYLAHFHK